MHFMHVNINHVIINRQLQCTMYESKFISLYTETTELSMMK